MAIFSCTNLYVIHILPCLILSNSFKLWNKAFSFFFKSIHLFPIQSTSQGFRLLFQIIKFIYYYYFQFFQNHPFFQSMHFAGFFFDSNHFAGIASVFFKLFPPFSKPSTFFQSIVFSGISTAFFRLLNLLIIYIYMPFSKSIHLFWN